VITGASSGIGEATARRLAREPGAKLVLVARRQDRLDALARSLGGATAVAADLTAPDAPAAVLEAVGRAHGELDLLVNNAGARWAGTFGESGWENVERHMKIDFDAQVRLTEALLPLLRATAQKQGRASAPIKKPAIVNVSSTSGRVARPNGGGYSAAKFALIGWSDALAAEERGNGVHVGLVLPGFILTEGFPATELRANPLTRLIVSKPEVVAEAIVDCGLRGKAERYAPRYYWLAAAARVLAPRFVARAVAGGAFTTATNPDRRD
jgi:uncharacterized protein